MRSSVLAAAVFMMAQPVLAQTTPSDPLLHALAGALRGCETWVLEPASWSEGPAPFLAAMGLGDRVSTVEILAEPLLPPPALRAGNRYWRIAAGPQTGYALVVSDRVPMCHLSGGGSADLQPVAERLLASPEFKARWELVSKDQTNGVVSSLFRSRVERAFTMLVSRADAPGARRDRPQVVVTATYELRR